MALSAILASLKTTLEGVPGVAQVVSEVPAAPAALGDQFPAIVLQLGDLEYQPSNVSYWQYPIEILYLYALRGVNEINDDLANLYDVPQAIVSVLNQAATLGGKTYGPQFGLPAAAIGAIEWRDKSYSGVQVHLRLKEKSNTSYSG